MGSYRKVGDDILKEWLDFREEELGSLTYKEDKEHFIYFEEISTDILNMFLVIILNMLNLN